VLIAEGWRRTQDRVGGAREWVYRRDPNWQALTIAIADSTKNAALADYSAFADEGQKYLERRIGELTTLYGQASAGVSAILQTAAHALAAARYCTAMARRTGEPSWLTLASSHGRQAVQCELDASALCSKESKLWAKKKNGVLEELAAAFEPDPPPVAIVDEPRSVYR
jgi:hypothetical protein